MLMKLGLRILTTKSPQLLKKTRFFSYASPLLRQRAWGLELYSIVPPPPAGEVRCLVPLSSCGDY
jgi:hypothetical protein